MRYQLYVTLNLDRDKALIKAIDKAREDFPSATTNAALLRRIIEDWFMMKHKREREEIAWPGNDP